MDEEKTTPETSTDETVKIRIEPVPGLSTPVVSLRSIYLEGYTDGMTWMLTILIATFFGAVILNRILNVTE